MAVHIAKISGTYAKINEMNNAISWFEIPATDLDRATRFYETIFGVSLAVMDMPNIRMRMFPINDMMTQVGGAVVDSGGFHRPSATDGPLIYMNGNPDLQLVLDKVEAAGGQILVPKMEISPEYGYMAVFLDTEGNRIGLHSVPGGV
jgi:predicted enzyme related to lactoylglutathione lyase